jgi:hypothetical protein
VAEGAVVDGPLAGDGVRRGPLAVQPQRQGIQRAAGDVRVGQALDGQ